MTLRVEHGDLDRWILDLDRAVSDAPDEATKVVEKGALNIKTGAVDRISGRKHLPSYPKAITYDMLQAFRGPEAEIGPDKSKRQGALGNVLEHGSPGRAPVPHVHPSADEEVPRFEKAMADLSARLLEGQ